MMTFTIAQTIMLPWMLFTLVAAVLADFKTYDTDKYDPEPVKTKGSGYFNADKADTSE